MAKTSSINESLTDDELRSILSKLQKEEDKDMFGLVCKRWLLLQSYDRRRLRARAGPSMLRRMAYRFPAIVDLDFSQSASRSFYPGLTDSDLSVIATGFRSLRILDLHNCKGISDAGLVALGNGLPLLQSLDVSWCRKITDKGLMAIAFGCPDLRKLELPGCRFVTDALLKALSKNCRQLEQLGLSGCFSITDSGVSDLVEGCCHIKSLNVSKCSKIGDVGVLRVADVCSSSLKTLKLLDCNSVSNKSLLSLANSCRNLETLVFGGCRELSDGPLMSLVVALSYSLRCLRIDWCLSITDSSLQCVLSNCRNLVALDISCCDKITDCGFRGLTNGGFDSNLKVLMMRNLPTITPVGIILILEYCKLLEYIDLRSLPLVTRHGCEEAGLIFPEFCKVNFTGSLTEIDPVLDMYF